MTNHGMPRRSMVVKLGLIVIATGWLLDPAAPAWAAVTSPPCSANPESRQLDYWVGDWTVTAPGGGNGSKSTVSLSLDSCLLTESWDGGKGHRGVNMFAYSPDDRSWHGMFADNDGRVHVFTGKVAAGVAEFYGPGINPDGKTELNRIRIVRISVGRIEQTWEKSADNGSTWTTVFRGEYMRGHT